MASVDDNRVEMLLAQIQQLYVGADQEADPRLSEELRLRARSIRSTLRVLGLLLDPNDGDDIPPTATPGQVGRQSVRNIGRTLTFAFSRAKPDQVETSAIIRRDLGTQPSVTLLTGEAWPGGFGVTFIVPFTRVRSLRALRKLLTERWRVVDDESKTYRVDQRVTSMGDGWRGRLICIPGISSTASWIDISSEVDNVSLRLEAALFRNQA